MIDIPMAVALAFMAGFLIPYLHHKYKEHNSKMLYINEVKCPHCGARPYKPCANAPFDGQRYPYSCLERWYAVDKENEKRDKRREL